MNSEFALKTDLKTRILRYYSGYIVIGVGYMLHRLVFFKSTIEHVAYPGNSLTTNFLTMTKVIASYVKLWFLPVILNPDYHVTFETTGIKLPFLLSVALLICVVVITLRLCKKEKEITFSILWTFITLIPVMNVIPIGNIMAERYLYIPSLGFCLFLGILILRIPPHTLHLYRNIATTKLTTPLSPPLQGGDEGEVKNLAKKRIFNRVILYRFLAKFCFIGLFIFYFIFTIKQNRFWYDEQTLWSRTVSDTSCSFNAHNNLGKEYFQKGLVDKAIEEYTIALSKASEVQYKYPTAHYNLGVAYDEKSMYEAAIREYKNALHIDPKNSDTHNNLAIALFKNGKVDLAIEEFRTAITHDPDNPTYHDNLAKLYYRSNMPGEAKAEQELANRLKH
ncbi:MAG: tetratricopeptide repeat protein [Planctomycetes bacterium]|nr:tetratricopeptide repeat protein [Planctomycetota bacterium]